MKVLTDLFSYNRIFNH